MLHVFAGCGYLHGFQFIAKQTEDINPPNRKGETPLVLAVWNGQIKVVQFITSKIPPCKLNLSNDDGMTPIYAAALRGFHEIFQHLITLQNDTNWTTEILKDGYTAIQLAIGNDDENVFNFYEPYVTDWIQDQFRVPSFSLLHLAVTSQSVNYTKRIIWNLMKHESFNEMLERENSNTPLHYAVST